jgi:hypothetical protein
MSSILKIEDMDPKVEYIKCPYDECSLWHNEVISCLECPYSEKIVQLKKCRNCSQIIELPLGYSSMRRLNHRCRDGKTPLILLSKNIVTTRKDLEYEIGTGDMEHLK